MQNNLPIPIDIFAYQEGATLPDKLVVRDPEAETEFGIKVLVYHLTRVAGLKDGFAGINVFGNVIYQKRPENKLLFLIAYNEAGEVIGFASETTLKAGTDESEIDADLYFPASERVAQILIRPALDLEINRAAEDRF